MQADESAKANADPEAPKGADRVDVRAFIDQAKVSGYQKWLMALCFLTVFFDGFDVQALAVAAPLIKADLGLSPVQLGTLFALGSVGGILAGFSITLFADRVGRRPLIVATVFASGVLTLLYTVADSLWFLMVLRVAGGFFLAIAVTVVYAYSAEIAPKRLSATSVMITSAGFGLGVAATGFMSGWLMPHLGWHSIFYFGGGGLLVLGVVLLFALPESIRVMAQRGDRHRRSIHRYLTRIDPAAMLSPDATFYLDEESRAGSSLRNLLKEKRALPGIALWIGCFFINFVVYVFMQWLPSFVTTAGSDAGRAGAAIGWFKIAGIMGSFACAFYIDRRRNPYPILSAFLLLGALSFVFIGELSADTSAFLWVIALTGLLLSGPQYANNGLMARLFPTYVRTTGMAITAGVGRVGAMAGPFTVGLLLQAGWSNKDIFLAGIAPTLISAGILMGLGIRDYRLSRKAVAA